MSNNKGVQLLNDVGCNVGEFKDRTFHGQGTYTWSDERKNVVEWKDGEEWNVTEYVKFGKIIGKFVNGEYMEE